MYYTFFFLNKINYLSIYLVKQPFPDLDPFLGITGDTSCIIWLKCLFAAINDLSGPLHISAWLLYETAAFATQDRSKQPTWIHTQVFARQSHPECLNILLFVQIIVEQSHNVNIYKISCSLRHSPLSNSPALVRTPMWTSNCWPMIHWAPPPWRLCASVGRACTSSSMYKQQHVQAAACTSSSTYKAFTQKRVQVRF